MGLKIGQINAQRSRAASVNLELIMKELELDILCLQEPYTYKSKVRGYTSPGMRIIQPGKESPWVAAVVKEQRMEIFQNTAIESEHIMCFQVITDCDNFYIINVYCQYSLEISPIITEIEYILDKLKGNRIILTMDANAKSNLWFAGRADERGKELEEIILSQSLHIVNKPNNPPTFTSSHGESNIDVTLITANMLGQVENWRVETTCTTSDHNLIVFNISSERYRKRKCFIQEGFKIKRANWVLFNKLTQSYFDEEALETLKKGNANKAVKEFNNLVTEICKGSIPKRRISNRTVPWWNEELTRLRKLANNAKRQLIRARKLQLDNIDFFSNNYKKKRNTYVKEILKNKTVAWRKFVNKVGNEDPWSMVYKIVSDKIKKPNYMCSLSLPTGQQTLNWTESINALLDKCVPKDEQISESAAQKELRKQNAEYLNCNLEPDISEDEITLAIKKLKNNKAPGVDNFQSEIIKALWKDRRDILYNIFNLCLRESVFPDEWKTTSLKIILKDKSKDRSKINSYRPIALIPTMGKVFERIILNRIMDNYKNKKMENNRQFGFKKGLSTDDAFLKLRGGISTEKKYVVALFVDIEGAFDNLWWPAIKNRLIKAECSNCLIKIIDNYFKRRKIIVKSKYEEVTRIMEKGCPQGSIIGPIAWNFCMDALLRKLEDEIPEDKAEAIAYADDLVIIIKGNSRTELETIGNKAVNILIDWCNLHKLKTSTSKTLAMLMKGKLDRERMPRYKIEDKIVKYCTETKYLGLLIDEKLNFVSHAKYLREKLIRFIMNIKRVAREEWGLKGKIMKVLYNAVVIPITTYGAIMWWDKTSHTLVKRHLFAAQRVLLMTLTRACRTSSTSALQVLSGMMPLDLAVIQRGLVSQIKRCNTVNWSGYTFQGMNVSNAERKAEEHLIKMEIFKVWQKRWDEDDHGRVTYKFIKNVKFAKNEWFSPGRKCIYILTGYGPIKSTLYIRGASTDNKCAFCSEEETIEHMLFKCSEYEEFRYELLYEEENNWINLISNKERFVRFNEYVNDIITKRNILTRQLDINGSASAWQGRATAGQDEQVRP